MSSKPDMNKRRSKPERDRDGKIKKNIERLARTAEEELQGTLSPYCFKGLSGYERKLMYRYFDDSQEFSVRSYRDGDEHVLKVFPTGQLKRLAEQKVQEVLMQGAAAELPPMGAYERFVIHDYLQGREGISTKSFGEKGNDRHVKIMPVFGRSKRKIKKRKLTI